MRRASRMARLRRWMAGLALASVAVGAWADDPEPFSAPVEPGMLTEVERRAWSAAEDADRELRRSPMLYRDPALSGYLQRILDGLYPELDGAVRLRGVIRDADPNASVLPNGSVYLTLGLIGRLSSEAQIATVLGHEAAHFVQRHTHKQVSSAKSMSALGQVIGVLGGAGGAIGNVLLVGALYGYSRDHEREADRVGFERIVRAGHSPSAGVQAFEILAAEALLYKRPRPTFFASHPSMQERVQAFRELAQAAGASPERGDADPYREFTRTARQDYLRLAVETGRQKSVVSMLAPGFDADTISPTETAYLGEAYRLRAEEGDAGRAEAAYARAVERAPHLAIGWRGLAEMARRSGDREKARQGFEAYLQRAPDAPDAGAVRAELERLGSESSGPGDATRTPQGGKDVR